MQGERHCDSPRVCVSPVRRQEGYRTDRGGRRRVGSCGGVEEGVECQYGEQW